MPLTQDLLDKLNQALVDRSVTEAFALLRRADKDIARLNPSSPQAVGFLLCIAQWVDLGYRDFAFLDELAERFAAIPRGELPFGDYVRLRMVEALRAFVAEDTARSRLESSASFCRSSPVSWSHTFWSSPTTGNAARIAVRASMSSLCITSRRLKRSPSRWERTGLSPVTNIHESWLLFQRGQRREALRLLDEAEAELKSTGHALSLGNIESARGRFVRKSGEISRALAHFECAIEIYGETIADHPNRARALVNAAYVKRLIALDLRNRSSGRAKGADHLRYLEICQEALELLRRAGDIYSRHHHQAGTGSVLVNAGICTSTAVISTAPKMKPGKPTRSAKKAGSHPDGAGAHVAGCNPKRAC